MEKLLYFFPFSYDFCLYPILLFWHCGSLGLGCHLGKMGFENSFIFCLLFPKNNRSEKIGLHYNHKKINKWEVA